MRAVLLPVDPDGSARALRARLGCAVVIGDSFGRPWRVGQAEVAIGCAGLAPLEDWRGRPTAPAASCTRRRSRSPTRPRRPPTSCAARTRGEPAVRLRGLERHVLAEDGPGAAALLRAPEQDLFG